MENVLEVLEAYPNPVVTHATIRFSLESSTSATLKVFDVNSSSQLFQGKVKGGKSYEVQFNRNNYMPGVYIYRLTTASGKVFQKQLIIK